MRVGTAVERVWETTDAYIERHDLPNGATIYYKDGDGFHPSQRHSYWRRWNGGPSCSGRYGSISSASGVDGETNKDGLLDWAARLDREGVAREASLGLSLDDVEDMRHALGWLRSAEAITETLEGARLTWRDIRAERGAEGDSAHALLEALAAGEDVTPTNGYELGVVRFWRAHRPAAALVEQVVASESMGLAGRFDLFTEDGTLWDLKTSKWHSRKFALQANLYRLAGIECELFDAVEALRIIQVRADGAFRVLPVEIDEEAARNCAAAWRSGARVGKSVMAATKSTPWCVPEGVAA